MQQGLCGGGLTRVQCEALALRLYHRAAKHDNGSAHLKVKFGRELHIPL